MIVCPLCENPQAQGDTCDVCGRRLLFAPPTTEQYPLLQELELTAIESAGAASAVQAQPMAELERHRADAVQVLAQAIPDFERTPLAGAGEAA
ncbi:MAG: hypothetical protein HY901_04240, partial [Deltaproteobacteria bacterium]|nr:hypothetical protein [Deltaproteobacteria bacterium]